MPRTFRSDNFLPEIPREEQRRQEPPRRWTDQDEVQHQKELAERKQFGFSQGESQRILGPQGGRQEAERRQEERRQNPEPITCPACRSGVLQGQACTNCGTTIDQILNKPSRDEPQGYQPSPYLGSSPSDPEDENKRSEDFDTEDSVLDALEDKVVPEGKKRKEAIVSVPPGGEEPNAQGGPSYPPGAVVPPEQGGPSTPPEGEIPHHEVAQPFVGYEGVETGNPAVDQQVEFEIMNKGLNPEQARQHGLERQQDALRQQHQEGWKPQNLYQVSAVLPSEQPSPNVGPGEGRVCSMCHAGVVRNGACSYCKRPAPQDVFHQYRGLDAPHAQASVNPVGEVLSHYDNGFVSQAAVDKAKKLLK